MWLLVDDPKTMEAKMWWFVGHFYQQVVQIIQLMGHA